MPHAHFVMSTGRCSTQFLAKRLAGLDADVLVEHEPLLAGDNPRAIFRKPAQTLRTLGGNVPLQRNPVHKAASLLTHGLFGKAGKGSAFQNRAQVQRALSSELVPACPPLFDGVKELAQDALLEASNVQALAANYRQRRI